MLINLKLISVVLLLRVHFQRDMLMFPARISLASVSDCKQGELLTADFEPATQ
jgi:hypothetical protein